MKARKPKKPRAPPKPKLSKWEASAARENERRRRKAPLFFHAGLVPMATPEEREGMFGPAFRERLDREDAKRQAAEEALGVKLTAEVQALVTAEKFAELEERLARFPSRASFYRGILDELRRPAEEPPPRASTTSPACDAHRAGSALRRGAWGRRGGCGGRRWACDPAGDDRRGAWRRPHPRASRAAAPLCLVRVDAEPGGHPKRPRLQHPPPGLPVVPGLPARPLEALPRLQSATRVSLGPALGGVPGPPRRDPHVRPRRARRRPGAVGSIAPHVHEMRVLRAAQGGARREDPRHHDATGRGARARLTILILRREECAAKLYHQVRP